MKYLKTVPFYTFLLALFFCLHGAVENYGNISAQETINIFWRILLCLSSVFFIVFLFSKSVLYAGFICFFLGSLYLFFGAIKSSLSTLPFLSSYTVLLPVLLLVTALVIRVTRKKNAFLSKATFYLNILFILYCIFDSVILCLKSAAPPVRYTENIVFNSAAVKNKPDVYLLLLDEYAGYASLRDSFNFRNDDFYNKLKSDGFTIIPSFSNYSITYFSMSSLLNMDYLKDIKDSSRAGAKEMQRRSTEIKRAKIFSFFRDNGYEVKTYSLFEVSNNERVRNDPFILAHERLLTHKLFHNVILRDIGWNFAIGKYPVPAIKRLLLDDKPLYNGKIEKGLFSTVKKGKVPQFIYCHFLLPHAPFYFDSVGTPLSSHTSVDEKELYLSYLKYSNKKILSYTKAIIENNSGAIVILLSDHGFRDDRRLMPVASFDNICAIRLPSRIQEIGLKQISNVNVFRYILNENFNQSLPYLMDKRVFLK